MAARPLLRRPAAGLFLAALSLGPTVQPAVAAAKGGAPGQFLSYGAGARSMGMGKAFIAISDDASAAYWNPAAMVQVERKELQAMHATLFQATNFDSISYVHPTARAGTLGFNHTRLVSGGFEKVAVTVDPTSQELVKLERLGTYADVHQSFSLSYGRYFLENMSIGASFKMINHTIDTFAQNFMAMDTAFFAKGLMANHRLSVVAQNVVSQAPSNSDDRLPLTLRFGNAYSILRDRLNVAMDINQNAFSGLGWNFGAEYWAMRWAALRMGLEGHADGIGETTAGLGIRYRHYSLDLAMGIHELGISQRASASWRFGGSAKKGQKDNAQALMKQGHELFRQGNYLQAIQKFSAALDADPSNKEIQSMVAKLQDVVADLPKAPSGEVGRLVAAGVKSYMEGDLDQAYDAFRAAFDREPENAQLMNLTNRVAKMAKKPLVEAPKGPSAKARWTLVDQKLHDALQAIYEGRYDVAIQKCDEVLRIEPDNVVAIGRMGAAFFLLGEKEKAVALWKRALELDPSHRPAIEYLQQLGEYGR
jgi:tetratricopeptide (TPR) repeat protein